MTILNGVPLEPEPSREPRPTASAESQSVGRVAGIVALIASVVFPPAGVVIGAIALQQARLGGYRNGLARAGVIVGSVLTALAIAVIVALAVLVPQWVHQIAQLCEEHGVVVESPGSYECTL